MPTPTLVVLDGRTANPGDLGWEPLQALGTLAVHDRTPRELVVARAREAEIVLTNKTVLDRDALAALPALRYVGVLATGYNVVDVRAARERGVVVTNVPEYGTASVAQAVFGLLLELTSHVGHLARTVREGRWSASPDFCYWDEPLVELAGLTFGVVGFGRIGRAVARVAAAFGMSVIACDPAPPPAPPDDVRFVDLETLFREADVVSLHCPLTAENAGLVDAARLGLMKPTAYLLNAARGGLVRDADLAAALEAGRIAGAGLDVLSAEPPPPDNPLLRARHCVVTPHVAWATRAARQRLIRAAADNVRAFLDGRPVNVVT
jgi:glycerate dehydrogenase